MPKSQSKYRVIVPYREPVYEVHRGRPLKKPYLAAFEIQASTKEEAIAIAISRVKSGHIDSNVGWIRVPILKGIKVELL